MRIPVIFLVFLLTVVSGNVLTKWGRPYLFWIFTLHKLFSLALFALVIITLYPIHTNIGLSRLNLILIILTGVFFIVAFVTGGILDQNESAHENIKLVHKTTSVILLFLGIVLFLFN